VGLDVGGRFQLRESLKRNKCDVSYRIQLTLLPTPPFPNRNKFPVILSTVSEFVVL
jgi:hypothetical protein